MSIIIVIMKMCYIFTSGFDANLVFLLTYLGKMSPYNFFKNALAYKYLTSYRPVNFLIGIYL